MKKNTYSKIVILIFISNLLLFTGAFIIVNIMIPWKFESDACKTIESEIMQFKADQTQGSTYLSGAVQFIFPEEILGGRIDADNVSYLHNYSRLQKIEKKEIIEYVSENKLSEDICYLFENENGRYLLALIADGSGNDPDSQFIIYINISPFFRYNYLWNLMLSVLFVFISAAVLKIGSQLNRKNEEAHEAELKFFQNISHELKTPLMAIQGYAEGIRSGIEEPFEASGVILEENRRMTKIIEELLYISKLDKKGLQLDMEKNDIREIVYGAMKLVESAARSHQIELIPDMPSEAVYVRCDEEQTIKALSNILSNAVNYATKRVLVTCSLNEEKVSIGIQDDGKGIEEKDLEHVFERFYTTRKGGTGIGLSIAYEIIVRQNGDLEARNTSEGALFTIRFPAIEYKDAYSYNHQSNVHQGADKYTPYKGEKHE